MGRFNIFNFIKYTLKTKLPISDGKIFIISDSIEKAIAKISPWHIITLPQPAPVVLGLFSKRREC